MRRPPVWWMFLMTALCGRVSAQQAHTVALHPVEGPHGAVAPDSVRSLFDSLISVQLRNSGHTAIAWRQSGTIWRRLVDSVQGFYDPITGDTVRAEYAAVHAGTVAELASRFGATAWLRPTFEVSLVDWNRGKAQWDGVSEGVAPAGRGTVGALSLVIVVEDAGGRVLATGRGGIQVLAKVKGSQYEPVPPDKLLADGKRNAKAVQLALAPFLTGGRTAP